jgi:hypothetical protein
MINLGIIGVSEGNGHPYSWSAIVNGYDNERMKRCPFYSIPNYLSKEDWPQAMINNATVSHIWTQDDLQSKEIADSCFIKNICKKKEDMIGEIDGLLYARDDAQNNIINCKPFLQANLPVYIDKPVAFSTDDLNLLLKLQKYDGQIFTCSALKYAKEMFLSEDELEKLGKIEHIYCEVPKSWRKYIIHVLDPIFEQFSYLEINDIKIINDRTHKQKVSVKFVNNISALFVATNEIETKIKINYIGKRNAIEKYFYNPFQAFKTSINLFIDQIINKKKYVDWSSVAKMIKIIENGYTK